MTEKFAPTVEVPGVGTVTPPNWMWILALAAGGCDWAIREADTEEFRERARQWYRDRRLQDKRAEIEWHLERVRQLQREIEEGCDAG